MDWRLSTWLLIAWTVFVLTVAVLILQAMIRGVPGFDTAAFALLSLGVNWLIVAFIILAVRWWRSRSSRA